MSPESPQSENFPENSVAVRPGLSVCIITLNEEDKLNRCLDALSFADEIVVLDSLSRDRTQEIARERGARVFERKFDGFVNQKNHVISLARRRWVLIVDADEVVTPELGGEIKKIVDEDPEGLRTDYAAYRIARKSFYLGKWIQHCGWYPEYKIRLFLRDRGEYKAGTIHEQLGVVGQIGYIKRGYLEHYSYRNISDHLLRMESYSTRIALDKYQRGKKSSIFWAISKGISKFMITYIYHRGFLDGGAGLVISILAGYYNFLKYIKLWEFNRGLRETELGEDHTSHPVYRQRV